MATGRRLSSGLAGLAALALAACGADPGAIASPSPSPSPLPSGSIALVSQAPVLKASDLGDGHYKYVLPAAYFEADGTRHAFVVGFGTARGDQDVFHATSVDGLDWAIDEEPSLRDLGLELSPPGPIPGSVLPMPDGSWVMYLWGVPAPQFEGAVIYRATASSPAGPWVADPGPVVELGEPGAWDDVALDFPAVVATDDGFLMLYGGIDGNQTTRIGVATSTDGITWVKDAEPVLEADSCAKPGAQFAAGPRLMTADDGYRLLLDQNRETHLATSSDGHAWTCAGPDPLLVGGDVPGGQGIHTIAATQADGEVSVLIESLTEDASEIWLGELQLDR